MICSRRFIAEDPYDFVTRKAAEVQVSLSPNLGISISQSILIHDLTYAWSLLFCIVDYELITTPPYYNWENDGVVVVLLLTYYLFLTRLCYSYLDVVSAAAAIGTAHQEDLMITLHASEFIDF